MTRTVADVQAEIDAVDSDFAIEANGLRVSYERAWVQSRYEDAMVLERKQRDVARRTAEAKAPLEAELKRLARIELDAATSLRNRRWAMTLREAWLGQDPFAEKAENDYSDRDAERLETWDHLPLDEVRRWASVADALERGWY